ncbi:MAG: hypothetical protein HQK49_10915 [Oligoflexia bacterium]|nr:hypothetical protein [Oligoflexia bacterium]
MKKMFTTYFKFYPNLFFVLCLTSFLSICISTSAFSNEGESRDECIDWGKAQGNMGSEYYCSEKLGDGPIQNQIKPAPSTCKQYKNDMILACKQEIIITATNYSGPSRKSCLPFTSGVYANDFSIMTALICRAASIFMEPDPDDEIQNCLITQVFKKGRNSQIQVKNLCGIDIHISDIDVYWSKNVKPEGTGKHIINKVIAAGENGDVYITIHQLKQKSIFSGWDFKYLFNFTAANHSTNVIRTCNHWAQEPNIIEKVCE